MHLKGSLGSKLAQCGKQRLINMMDALSDLSICWGQGGEEMAFHYAGFALRLL